MGERVAMNTPMPTAYPTAQSQREITPTIRPPSRGLTGIRLNRFSRKPGGRERVPQQRPRRPRDEQTGERPHAPEDGASDSHDGLHVGVARKALHRDHRAHERDEDGCSRVKPEPFHDDGVAGLVYEDQENEPRGEGQAPVERVDPDRQQHREEGAQVGELQQRKD
jgi:hypothetical protein